MELPVQLQLSGLERQGVILRMAEQCVEAGFEVVVVVEEDAASALGHGRENTIGDQCPLGIEGIARLHGARVCDRDGRAGSVRLAKHDGKSGGVKRVDRHLRTEGSLNDPVDDELVVFREKTGRGKDNGALPRRLRNVLDDLLELQQVPTRPIPRIGHHPLRNLFDRLRGRPRVGRRRTHECLFQGYSPWVGIERWELQHLLCLVVGQVWTVGQRGPSGGVRTQILERVVDAPGIGGEIGENFACREDRHLVAVVKAVGQVGVGRVACLHQIGGGGVEVIEVERNVPLLGFSGLRNPRGLGR